MFALSHCILYSTAIPTSIASVARSSLFIHYNKALLFIANIISEDVTLLVFITHDCFGRMPYFGIPRNVFTYMIVLMKFVISVVAITNSSGFIFLSTLR